MLSCFNMARTKEVRVQTSFRLPEDLFNRLNDQAHLRDLSVNWLVTKAIELFLERLEENHAEVDAG